MSLLMDQLKKDLQEQKEFLDQQHTDIWVSKNALEKYKFPLFGNISLVSLTLLGILGWASVLKRCTTGHKDTPSRYEWTNKSDDLHQNLEDKKSIYRYKGWDSLQDK